jgi:hypothetical protein
MEYFRDYIHPELLVLVPVLIFLGQAFKKAWHGNVLPLILILLGSLLAVVWLIGVSDIGDNWYVIIFVAITQGAICGGLAVAGYDIYKIMRNK